MLRTTLILLCIAAAIVVAGFKVSAQHLKAWAGRSRRTLSTTR